MAIALLLRIGCLKHGSSLSSSGPMQLPVLALTQTAIPVQTQPLFVRTHTRIVSVSRRKLETLHPSPQRPATGSIPQRGSVDANRFTA